ncbi:MAG: hypothetical protein ABTQ34_09210 [Bdellovibrionales bacterium]
MRHPPEPVLAEAGTGVTALVEVNFSIKTSVMPAQAGIPFSFFFEHDYLQKPFSADH